jgi:hypothetical protein
MERYEDFDAWKLAPALNMKVFGMTSKRRVYATRLARSRGRGDTYGHRKARENARRARAQHLGKRADDQPPD